MYYKAQKGYVNAFKIVFPRHSEIKRFFGVLSCLAVAEARRTTNGNW